MYGTGRACVIVFKRSKDVKCVKEDVSVSRFRF